MVKKRNTEIYDKNVNYAALEQHEYDDAEGYTFYTCPCCFGEYLASLIFEEDGKTMCVDCWDKHRKRQ